MIYRTIAIALVINTGILLFGLGIISQRFLDLLHYQKADGKWRLRALERLFINHGLIIGLGWLLTSSAFFYKPLLQLIETAHITVSWAYVLTGSFFFSLGFQFIGFGVLGVIFHTVISGIKDQA